MDPGISRDRAALRRRMDPDINRGPGIRTAMDQVTNRPSSLR
jgi:hypothetical protein